MCSMRAVFSGLVLLDFLLFDTVALSASVYKLSRSVFFAADGLRRYERTRFFVALLSLILSVVFELY